MAIKLVKATFPGFNATRGCVKCSKKMIAVWMEGKYADDDPSKHVWSWFCLGGCGDTEYGGYDDTPYKYDRTDYHRWKRLNGEN